MHSPGPDLGRSPGNNPVDISLSNRGGPTSRSRPTAIWLPAFVFEPRYLHPYSPSDSRHPLTSRDDPPRHWCDISVRNVMGARYSGGRTPLPYSRAAAHNGNPFSLARGQRCTIVAVNIPFMVSDERAVKHLIPTLGSSLIASSAYQKWPTWNCNLSHKFN